jgi:4-amino-4-deoxy-L-arabinose transferase-like glycosyltransferase
VPRRPWLPALVFATAPIPFFAANWISTDFVLAACETLAVACFVQARFVDGRARWLDGMWAAFGLAFLAKGPPALLPLLAIVAFSLHERRALALLRPLGLLAFAAIGLAWYGVVVARHPGLLDYFLGHEVVARIATPAHDRYPQWYGWFVVYAPTLLLGALPWTAWLLKRPVEPRDDGDPAPRRFLWFWLALPLVVFCLSRSRLPLYVLPLFVPLALLLGRALDRRAPGRGTWIVAGAWVVLLLGLKAAVAHYPHDKDAREYARKLVALVPGKPREFVFVEDMTRYGLHLYTGAPSNKVSFKAWPKPVSDANYDMSLAQSLAQADGGRVYVMKPEKEGPFLDAAHGAGVQPVLLGEVGDIRGRDGYQRRVYTLAGDFPAAPAR